MCIRDRFRDVNDQYAARLAGQPEEFEGREVLGTLPVKMKVAQPALIARRPVSYTHLRAHETVLDLVCRLLLEKKKT